MRITKAAAQPAFGYQESIDMQGVELRGVRAILHEVLDNLIDRLALDEGQLAALHESGEQLNLGLGIGNIVAMTTRKSQLLFRNEHVTQMSELYPSDEEENQSAPEKLLCCMLMETLAAGRRLTLAEVTERTGYATVTVQAMMGQIRIRCDKKQTWALEGDKEKGWNLRKEESSEISITPDPEDFVLPLTRAAHATLPELRFSKSIGEIIRQWQQQKFRFLEKRTDQAVAALLLEQMCKGGKHHTVLELAQRIGLKTVILVQGVIRGIETAASEGKIPVRVVHERETDGNDERQTVRLEAMNVSVK